MQPTEFVIIGGGWRAEFFLRIARELPERFTISGMFVRDSAKGQRFEALYGVKTYRNLDELLKATKPLFAVVSVIRSVAPAILEELTNRDLPALCETPPAGDVPSLAKVNELTKRGGRIQVAEQYIFQPMHAARLAVARAGLLGTVSQAQISYTQAHHGMSLIRHYLGVGFDPVRITARRFEFPIFKGPDRSGPPTEEKIIPSKQILAWLEFGDRLGVFDFISDQHRSYVRSHRILVRGERGEINQSRVRCLADFRTPVEFELQRFDAGIDDNLEGYFHKGIFGGDRWWYQNAFAPARLPDDELAIATCLDHMADYARGGKSFYSLAEASHDLYLSLMMEQSAQQRQTIEVFAQPWAVEG